MTLTTAIKSPAIQKGALSVVGALVVLAFPQLLGELLFLLVGLGAIAVGLIEIRLWWNSRLVYELFQALLLIVVGVVVVFGGDQVHRLLEVIVAGLVALMGLRGIYVGHRASERDQVDPFWAYIRGTLALGLAVSVVLIPEAILTAVIIVIGLVWIVSGVVVLVNAIGEDDDSPVPADVIGVIRAKSMPGDLRRRITENVFEGWDSHEGTIRFVALMSFATAIATFGVKADSTAVVIGAMLIAPLMNPIMALTAGVLMGWPKRVARSAWRVGLGIVIGVLVASLMSLISPDFTSITTNSQVLSRTSPTILDLMIALAAGSAGAYALTHPKVSNSLPGVAIAVALAPPLAVVGVSLEAGEWSFAGGAFLLFLTNLVGIIFAGGVAFVLSGYSPLFNVERSGQQGRRSLALVITALVLVAIPLAVMGDTILDEVSSKSRAQDTVDEWLGEDSLFAAVKVNVDGSNVEVVIVGTGDPPDPEELATSLTQALDRSIKLELSVIPESHFEVSATRSGSIIDNNVTD
jgi:uncharacterized hydrophobic protein (TIGR00271 family)